MANRYVRSLFWLFSCTGVGYGLLLLTSPSEEHIKNLKKELPGLEKNSREVVTKNRQFTNVLQSASGTSKPLYRMSKSEIEKELGK